MASYSRPAPMASQEEFSDLYECDTDSLGKPDCVSQPDTLDRGNADPDNAGDSTVSDQNTNTRNDSIATLYVLKQNVSTSKNTKDEMNITNGNNTVVKSSHDVKNIEENEEECNSGTGSRYFLRSSSYGSQCKSPKGSFVYSCDGSPLRLGPETAILGYAGKHCKECDTSSHEQGQHSSETLFLEELYANNAKMNSSKDVTVDSLVVFNTITGERLLPDGCEEQMYTDKDEHETVDTVKSNNSDDGKNNLHDTCILVCKKVFVFSVSNVGLACIVVAYAILGAIIFQSLEAWNEKKTRSFISEMRSARMKEIRDIVNQLNHLNKEAWTNKADKIMKTFQRELYTKTKGHGWDGVDDVVEGERDWTFVGALLYSVTLITTIGYGDITPKTASGRIATMFYAMLGIPLTLLCLANFGNVMAQTFRQLFYRMEFKVENMFSYLKGQYIASKNKSEGRTIFNILCTRHMPCKKSSRSEMELEERQDGKYRGIECELCQVVSDAEFPCEHVNARSASKCTVRQDEVSRENEHLPFNMAGSIDSSCNSYDKQSESKSIGSLDIDQTCPTARCQKLLHGKQDTDETRPKAKHNRLKRGHKGMSIKQRKKLEKDVPIWVCLVVVISYNLLGSLLFGLWEEGWGFITGFYFCFITLSTIGFGDIVPGHSIESWQSQEKQIICTIYLLVGMAMLAMCFDLMQRQIRERARHCAVWIGLLDEHDTHKITAV
ncbi:uncharacterized protein LOC110449615 [Mizuhopecten yessoensis]|uniref:TWiK family of potassium channels protein 18 n=1 Tax=Mizuhopecten yessoensis TaxID=6573 RepID=A0A210QQS9_MIZYE|nr:uncharacterized protein LOC110449615 [Mizuhopecten yessoensis]OWF51097.1 TWiK family of potassium channels protein 18 [Mizuhopecten yessoensis]